MELRDIQKNEILRRKLAELKISIRHLAFEELVLCKNGSVSKKFVCGKFN